MEPTKRQRELISRGAAGVLGALFCFGAYHCIRVAWTLLSDSAGSIIWLLSGFGAVLGFLGIAAVLYALTPSSVFQKIMGPPKDTTLWEGSGGSDDYGNSWFRLWRWCFWWW